ncbi:hypothetical protein HDV01_000719 [Terramyces sp. JEL0728]|nr:hypothetical protein HDV01_000719 [Terramyces sp. JEL0728]
MFTVLLAALVSSAPSSYSYSLFNGVPNELQPPSGTKLMAKYFGSGTQNYVCQATGWVLDSADAVLSKHSFTLQHPEVSHYFVNGKPTWRFLQDESVVTGKADVKTVVTKTDIPWILLESVPALSSTTGKFSKVTYVMRVHTKKGVAPTSACNVGDSIRVAYNADYWFFTK